MARGKKYIGKIYEGRWEVIRFEPYGHQSHAGRFVLKNIYNGNEISFKDQTLRRIDRGEITLSKIVCRRIRRIKKYKRIRTYNW